MVRMRSDPCTRACAHRTRPSTNEIHRCPKRHTVRHLERPSAVSPLVQRANAYRRALLANDGCPFETRHHASDAASGSKGSGRLVRLSQEPTFDCTSLPMSAKRCTPAARGLNGEHRLSAEKWSDPFDCSSSVQPVRSLNPDLKSLYKDNPSYPDSRISVRNSRS